MTVNWCTIDKLIGQMDSAETYEVLNRLWDHLTEEQQEGFLRAKTGSQDD